MPASTTVSAASLIEAVAEINRLLAAAGLPGGEFDNAPAAPKASKFEDKVVVRIDERGVGVNAAGAYVARKKAIDPRGLYAAWADARKAAKLSGSPPRLPQATPPRVVPAPKPPADASLEQLVAMVATAYPEAMVALRAIWAAKASESSCKAFVHLLMGYRK